MKLYRYELKSNNDEIKLDKHTGILTALEQIFEKDFEKDMDKLCNLFWFFEEYLECPNIPLSNTTSFFTEKGNRKFNKAIKNLKKAYAEKGIDVVLINEYRDNIKSIIVYEDENQVIIKRDVYEGSTTIM